MAQQLGKRTRQSSSSPTNEQGETMSDERCITRSATKKQRIKDDFLDTSMYDELGDTYAGLSSMPQPKASNPTASSRYDQTSSAQLMNEPVAPKPSLQKLLPTVSGGSEPLFKRASSKKLAKETRWIHVQPNRAKAPYASSRRRLRNTEPNSSDTHNDSGPVDRPFEAKDNSALQWATSAYLPTTNGSVHQGDTASPREWSPQALQEWQRERRSLSASPTTQEHQRHSSPVRAKLKTMYAHAKGMETETLAARQQKSLEMDGGSAITSIRFLAALKTLAADLELKHPDNVTLADGEGLIVGRFELGIGVMGDKTPCFCVDWKKRCTLETIAEEKFGGRMIENKSLLQIECYSATTPTAHLQRLFGYRPDLSHKIAGLSDEEAAKVINVAWADAQKSGQLQAELRECKDDHLLQTGER